VDVNLARRLVDGIAAASDPDWFEALYLASLDETRDAEKALDLVESIYQPNNAKSFFRIAPAKFRYATKDLSWYLTKAQGQPCLPGETEKQTGCIPKSKKPGKKTGKPKGTVEKFKPPAATPESPESDELYMVEIDPSWSPTWQKKIKDSQAFARNLYKKFKEGGMLTPEEILAMPRMLKGLHSKSVTQLYKKIMKAPGMGYKKNQINDLVEYAKKMSAKDKSKEDTSKLSESEKESLEQEYAEEKPVIKKEETPKKAESPKSKEFSVPELSKPVKKLLDNVSSRAVDLVKNNAHKFKKLASLLTEVIRKSDPDAEEITMDTMKEKLVNAFEEMEWTVNIDFDARGGTADRKKTLADNLKDEPRLKNLFEVGRSSGESDPELRGEWEENNFGIDVKGFDAIDRPKYGAVNWDEQAEGPAWFYGKSAIVLKKNALRDRITLAPSNTSYTDADYVSTSLDPFNSLARSGRAIQEAFRLTNGQIAEFRDMARTVPGGIYIRTGSYTELQMWGKIPFDSSAISVIRLPAYMKDYKSSIKTAELAEKQGIAVEYY